jgi:heptaprenylglyceryl phosphate synthase
VGGGAREGAGARRAARAGVDCVAVVADIAQRSRGSIAAAFRVHEEKSRAVT